MSEETIYKQLVDLREKEAALNKELGHSDMFKRLGIKRV